MNLYGSLYNSTSKKTTLLVRRSTEIDDVLTAAGYDPSEINTIKTPLVGAGRYATIKVLVAGTGFNGATLEVPFVESPDADTTDLFFLTLLEPKNLQTQGGTLGTNPIDGNVSTSGTNGGTITNSGNRGGGSQENFVAATGTVALAVPIQDLGRQLVWSNLICRSIQELVISAGSTQQKIFYRPQPNVYHPSLFVMELVDARYTINSALMLNLTPSSGSVYKSGTCTDQFNMIADNPLHLRPETTNATTRVSPDYTTSFVLSVNPNVDAIAADLPVVQPNAWYEQTPYTIKDIITKITNSFQTNSQWSDKEYISFDFATVAANYNPQSTFDSINLDLTSRTVGEALDEIAARAGCVWSWDRFASQLVLREANPALDEGFLDTWVTQNEIYRAAGGLNSLSIDMPSSVVSIHAVNMASTYGYTADKVIQDYRIFDNHNGVEGFKPTQALFYSNTSPRTKKTDNRTAYIGDHLPAFVGCVSKTTTDWNTCVPTKTPDVVNIVPWNLNLNKKEDCYWFSKSYAESIEARNRTLNRRYQRLRDLVSGNLILSRIPAAGNGLRMDQTPSVGLQHEEIKFGSEMNQQVQYRIYGDKKDSLLLPSLLDQPKISALGLARCRNVYGALNIQVLKPRAGLVRSFVCLFYKSKVISVDAASGLPTMWLYAFDEVQLQNLEFPKFSSANDRNNAIDGAAGYCLNLPEHFTQQNKPPSKNYDGGKLYYPASGVPQSQPSIVMTPVGGDSGNFGICYEVINEGGATTFWICIPNGVAVDCSAVVPFAPPNSSWPKSGASGIAFTNSDSLASIISL